MALLPSTAFQVAAIVVLLLPGLVYALARRAWKGYRPEDLSIDMRIAEALVFSVILDAIYFVAGWWWLSTLVKFTPDSIEIVHPILLGIAILIGCGVIPFLIALVNLPLAPAPRVEGEKRRLPRLRRTFRYSDVPTAWDQATSNPNHRMIRVRLPDGTWIGGQYAGGSFVSTFPQPRDLYISRQWTMERDGSFGHEIPYSDGVWLRIGDEHVVEFLDPERKLSTPQSNPGQAKDDDDKT